MCALLLAPMACVVMETLSFRDDVTMSYVMISNPTQVHWNGELPWQRLCRHCRQWRLSLGNPRYHQWRQSCHHVNPRFFRVGAIKPLAPFLEAVIHWNYHFRSLLVLPFYKHMIKWEYLIKIMHLDQFCHYHDSLLNHYFLTIF